MAILVDERNWRINICFLHALTANFLRIFYEFWHALKWKNPDAVEGIRDLLTFWQTLMFLIQSETPQHAKIPNKRIIH